MHDTLGNVRTRRVEVPGGLVRPVHAERYFGVKCDQEVPTAVAHRLNAIVLEVEQMVELFDEGPGMFFFRPTPVAVSPTSDEYRFLFSVQDPIERHPRDFIGFHHYRISNEGDRLPANMHRIDRKVDVSQTPAQSDVNLLGCVVRESDVGVDVDLVDVFQFLGTEEHVVVAALTPEIIAVISL